MSDYMLEYKEDAGEALDRFEAFFQGEVIDRPPVSMRFRNKDASFPAEEKAYPSLEARWLDIEHRAERAADDMKHWVFAGDALPIVWPNMGPEIFSAWCGCGYEYGEDTTWSIPSIEDWDSDAPRSRFDPQHPLFKKTLRYTELLVELGKGRFIAGLTDFHPGGDHLAAMRDPQRLAMDILDNPDGIKSYLQEIKGDYFEAYDRLYAPIAAAGMPATSWLPAAAFGRYYIPSCDFSALISAAQFEEFFLPGIIDECSFYDRSIYHLDGPGAIRHLDLLLDIPELNAVQWFPGAGHEELAQWIPLLKRILAGGKSVVVYPDPKELDLLFEHFSPKGIWLELRNVDDFDTAKKIIKRVEAWR